MVVTGLGLNILHHLSIDSMRAFFFLLGGNPVSVLQTQTNLDLVPVKHKCPMYECSHTVV